MTLEKLLIFGFALAALMAVTTLGSNMWSTREGAEGDFRSNLHRGGTASAIKITPEERSTAVRAARALGLNVAGVDMLRSNHGPVIMEVNSSPGLEGIESRCLISFDESCLCFDELYF